MTIISTDLKIDITKCCFCGKKIGVKKYIIKMYRFDIYVCSECEYLYKIVKNQVLSDRVPCLIKIIETARFGNNHCEKCIFFDTNDIEKCKIGYSTYINNSRYKENITYAFYGCSAYKESPKYKEDSK